MEKKSYKLGIVPGSFDPITVGHLDMILRATKMCEHVVVAVMINSSKKYSFTLDERKRIAEAALADVDRVEVVASDGMLFELAEALSADLIIKGVRNKRDLEYEKMMAEYNSTRTSAVTVLLDASESVREISSTAVRKIMEKGELPESLLPAGAINEIKKILASEK